ncbi:YqzM family protein [Geomicrobium sp. JCM 19055]|nr:YqzM family protein [Geomicrobium sp. JCM 19055]
MHNNFEKEVQSKRNDFNDAIVGVAVSFGFFATIFVIGVIIEFASRM